MTESENARSQQLFMLSKQQLTDSEWLPGEPLIGSECSKAQLVISHEISDLSKVNLLRLISINIMENLEASFLTIVTDI